jgi:hypothetical protein
MATQRLRTIQLNDLLDAIFSDEASALRARCARWSVDCARFPAFLDRYQDKIRKKLRGLPDNQGRRDLGVELLTAACLLVEPRFTLDYETYAASKTRGPDFSARYRTHIPFTVEVKRIRGQTLTGKWADVLCDKLRQLPPSMMNTLIIYGEPADQDAPFDVAAAMASLRATAERKDEAFFTRRGLEGARDYLRQSLKLSALYYRVVGAPLVVWINPQARHSLPADLRLALGRSLEAIAMGAETPDE